MALRAFVVGNRPEDRYLAGRTLRSLATAGISATFVSSQFHQLLAPSDRPASSMLLVRAGAWLVDPTPFPFPPHSATGRPTCAFGRLLGPNGDELDRWKSVLFQSGGDFDRTLHAGLSPQSPEPVWPSPVCLYFDAAAVARLAASEIGPEVSFAGLSRLGLRVVHFPRLDVQHTTNFRVIQVLTALHRGGAERLTLDLLEALPQRGIQTRLATVGRPFRSTFPSPPGTLQRLDPQQLRAFAVAHGFDLFHAHLLNRETLQRLGSQAFPLVFTLHNARAGWPEGIEQISAAEASLGIACSRAVESQAVAAGLPVPIRTAWNGIQLEAFTETPEIEHQARELRRSWGFDSSDIVLLALANPRPQKRLHLLPAILEALAALSQANHRPSLLPAGPAPGGASPPKRFRLVLAGESMPSPASLPSEDPPTWESELRKRALLQDVRQLGFIENTAALIRACDAMVSPSAFEGLSLAQLECLALGRTVVATAVGGAPEVAAFHPSLRLVPIDATPAAFAQAILEALHPESDSNRAATGASTPRPPTTGSPKRHPLAPFSTASMAARYHALYRRALAITVPPALPRAIDSALEPPGAASEMGGQTQSPSSIRPTRVWLITNNFSTGGAQSSARRWLRELHSRGIEVRAAVIQEDPDAPTPGRQALLQVGIPVISVPPPESVSPEDAVEALLHHLDAQAPSAVFFWNLIPVYKVLIADALFGVPIYDVSPGEMFFESLERYFASPLPHLPYASPRDYASRLAGVVVKFSRERARAEESFNIPVHVIPNGVVLEDFPPQTFPEPCPPSPASLTVSDDGPQAPLVFGTSARLHPHKRLEDLIDALHLAHAHLPPWRLRIAGGAEAGGEDFAESLRQRGNGLPIEWLGDVPDIPTFLASLDLFLMVSEPAGCPNALLEAMATGLPVIATNVGGANDLIHHPLSGWLVPPREPQAFADAILELARNPSLRRNLGQSARQRIEERFTVHHMVDRYLALLPGPAVQGTGPM